MAETKWYIKTIDQTLIEGGFSIVLTTDIACHMWLRHTLTPPRKHSIPVVQRGAVVAYDARFCFVTYEDLEQNEPGDTLTHTFTWLGWKTCEVRYFYFWAEVSGSPAPSTTAIFSKHYTAPPPPALELCLLEPWSVPVFPPPLERCLLEPWTDGGMFMRLAEHWLISTFPPPLESGILETWPTATWPPEFNLLIKEIWE